MPPVTATLIAINVATYLLSSMLPRLSLQFALWPINAQWALLPEAGFEPWQLVSYAFLHGNLLHLAFNMFGLYMFGSGVEQVFGARRYLTYYLTCVVSAALTQLVVLGWSGVFVPTVGASGGVFGLLLAYAVLFPHHRILLLFPPIPMRARVFVLVYAGLELVLGIAGTASGIAHFAHLGGMVGGWLLLRRWRVRALA